MPYYPRSSLPTDVLAWLLARLEHLRPPPRPPGRGGNPPLPLEARLDAVAAVLLDGLSYRRAARAVGVSKTAVGESVALLLPELAALGVCQPDGTFVRTLDDLAERLAEMTSSGEAVALDGAATRVARPRDWANQYQLYDAHRSAHTAQALVLSTLDGDLLWVDGGWPGRAHEQELVELSGLDGALAAAGTCCLVDRGFRGLAVDTGVNVYAPVGTRRDRERLTERQRAHNRLHAQLRAAVERAIAHLAGAGAFRRWRARLAKARDAIRAVGALVSLCRWGHRVPT